MAVKKKFMNHLGKKLQKRKELRKKKRGKGKQNFDKGNQNKKNGKKQNKKVSAKSKKVKFQSPVKQSGHNKQDDSGGFQMSSSSKERMAKLQEFVNKEAGTSNKQNPQKKPILKPSQKEKDTNKDENKGLIKDKEKLINLRRGQAEDSKVINQMARELGLNKVRREKYRPNALGTDFSDDFFNLLGDIEAGTLSHSSDYKSDSISKNIIDSDLDSDDDDLENKEELKGEESEEAKFSSDGEFNDLENKEELEGEDSEDAKFSSDGEFGDLEDEEDLDNPEDYSESKLDLGSDDSEEAKFSSDGEFGDLEGEEDLNNREDYSESKLDLGSEDSEEAKFSSDGAEFSEDDEDSMREHMQDDLEGEEDLQNNYEDSRELEEECEEDGEFDNGEELEDEEEDYNGSGLGFIDSEAEEDSIDEESDDQELVHDDTKEYELAFEAGSSYCKPEILKNGMVNDIDRYSSNTDDDTDLEDFVVDDDHVEYTSNDDDELPEELDESPLSPKKRKMRIYDDEEESIDDGEKLEPKSKSLKTSKKLKILDSTDSERDSRTCSPDKVQKKPLISDDDDNTDNELDDCKNNDSKDNENKICQKNGDDDDISDNITAIETETDVRTEDSEVMKLNKSVEENLSTENKDVTETDTTKVNNGVAKKKKKKKKKVKINIDNENDTSDDCENDVNKEISKKKKKKKKKVKLKLAPENESNEYIDNEYIENESIEDYENEISTKKMKKKVKLNIDGENELNEDCENDSNEAVSKPKKKRKVELNMDDENDTDEEQENDSGEIPKKKKKKKVKLNIANENDSKEDNENCENNLNKVVSKKRENVEVNKDNKNDPDNDHESDSEEVPIPKKKKKKKSQLTNGHQNDSNENYSLEDHQNNETDLIENGENYSNEEMDTDLTAENASKIPKKTKKKKSVDDKEEISENVAPISENVSANIDVAEENKTTLAKPPKKKKQVRINMEKTEIFSDTERDDNLDSEVKEDIYGRLRDKDGNVLLDQNRTNDKKYIPPALRKLQEMNLDEKKKEILAGLKRNLKGLLNRLAESNMAGIAGQIEGMYQKHSQNDMNDCLSQLYFDSLVIPTLTPERLVQEHASLIAVLSANIGNQVGAHMLTEFVIKFHDEMEDLKSTQEQEKLSCKRADNMLQFIANLFNFRVMNARVIYDILNDLADIFTEKEVELILMVLRIVGFSLRKDDPLALKNFITRIQSQTSTLQSKESGDYTRVCFLLEVINSIKNNNPSKVPNYDPSHVEHIKKVMKGMFHKGQNMNPLYVTLKDILNSRSQGRWWIVGSAWAGGLKENQAPMSANEVNKPKKNMPMENEFSEKFKKRAAKLQLTRPPRINIMYIITEGSEDYMDAFDKLLQLKLPSNQEQEMFNVILLCCQKGKVYNEFFSYLACRMCNFNKKYRRLLQFTVWDKLNEIECLKPNESENIARFLVHLIKEDGLHITILKNLSFVDADVQMISFVKIILKELLLHPYGSERVLQIFSKISMQPELNLFCQSIKVFISKFILSKKKRNNPKFDLLCSRSDEVIELLSMRGGFAF